LTEFATRKHDMDTETLAARMTEACEIAYEWVLGKLNNRDGLSVLSLLLTENDKEATIYVIEPFKQALEEAHEELESRRQDLVGYVLAYDGGWMDAEQGEQRAIFLEIEARGMDRPLRCAHRLAVEPSGVLALTGEISYWGPLSWSLFGEQEMAEAARLRKENAQLRERIKQLEPQNKKLEHITLTVDWHPKFTLLMTHIRHWKEQNEELQRQINFVQAQRDRGEQPSLWSYWHPEEIDPKNRRPLGLEKTIELLKFRVWELANRLTYLHRRHLRAALPPAAHEELRWGEARLFKKLKKLRETQEDTGVHERLWERLEAITTVEELHNIEKRIAELEIKPPVPSLDKLRRDHEKLSAEAAWLECQVNLRTKRQAEAAAAATSDDPKWVAEEVELEAKITELKQQNESLKAHLNDIKRIEIPDVDEILEELDEKPRQQYNPYTAAIEGVGSSFVNWLRAEHLVETALRLNEPSLQIDLFAGEIQPAGFADDRMKQCVKAHQEWLRGYMGTCKCPIEQVRSVRLTFSFGKPSDDDSGKRVPFKWRTELAIKDGQVFVSDGEKDALIKPAVKKTARRRRSTG